MTTSSASQEWQEPGAHLVAPGVYRIPLPLPMDGLRAVSVYAIVHDDRVVMIDAGWAIDESRAQLEQSLKSIDLGIGDITHFLVTHVHRDHYTQAVTIRREFGTRVSLGIGEQDSIEAMNGGDPREGQTQLDLMARFGAADLIGGLLATGWGGKIDTTQWERPNDWVKDGDSFAVGGRDLRAVHTPGHTRGHVVFTDQSEGLLFAGDHVLPHITPSIGFESRPGSSPLGDYLRSLALVRAMPDQRLLPAHGPVTDSVHARADELLAFHDERLTASLAAVAGGASTPYEAARVLGWTRRSRRFDDLDPWNQMLAICETAAHLIVLVSQGRLSQRTVEGVEYFAQD